MQGKDALALNVFGRHELHDWPRGGFADRGLRPPRGGVHGKWVVKAAIERASVRYSARELAELPPKNRTAAVYAELQSLTPKRSRQPGIAFPNMDRSALPRDQVPIAIDVSDAVTATAQRHMRRLSIRA